MTIMDLRLTTDLVRQARRLDSSVNAFDHAARNLHAQLSPQVSAAEIELLRSPASNLVCCLESLFGSQLPGVRKELAESTALLRQVGRLSEEETSCSVNNLGTALAVLRAVRRLSETELAQAADVRRATLVGYERGVATPGLKILERILAAAGLPLWSLEEACAFIANIDSLKAEMEEGR